MRIPLVLTVAVLALPLAGCTAAPPVVPIPPSPTATPAFASDQEALDAAVARLDAAIQLGAADARQGWIDDPRLWAYFDGSALEDSKESFTKNRAAGVIATGNISIDTPQLQQVERTADGYRITFYVCLDLSRWQLRDADGKREPLLVEREPRVNVAEGPDAQSLRITGDTLWTGSSYC